MAYSTSPHTSSESLALSTKSDKFSKINCCMRELPDAHCAKLNLAKERIEDAYTNGAPPTHTAEPFCNAIQALGLVSDMIRNTTALVEDMEEFANVSEFENPTGRHQRRARDAIAINTVALWENLQKRFKQPYSLSRTHELEAVSEYYVGKGRHARHVRNGIAHYYNTSVKPMDTKDYYDASEQYNFLINCLPKMHDPLNRLLEQVIDRVHASVAYELQQGKSEAEILDATTWAPLSRSNSSDSNNSRPSSSGSCWTNGSNSWAKTAAPAPKESQIPRISPTPKPANGPGGRIVLKSRNMAADWRRKVSGSLSQAKTDLSQK